MLICSWTHCLQMISSPRECMQTISLKTSVKIEHLISSDLHPHCQTSIDLIRLLDESGMLLGDHNVTGEHLTKTRKPEHRGTHTHSKAHRVIQQMTL